MNHNDAWQEDHMLPGWTYCAELRLIALASFLTIGLFPLSGEAQTASTPSPSTPSNPSNQNIAPQNLQGGVSAPSPGFSVPANVTTTQTTLGQNPAGSGSTTTSTRVTVGQGLPGMPGGPRLGGAGGAIDQSSDYMTPSVIGPLFCDPALNISC
jgi:hypothetical protein